MKLDNWRVALCSHPGEFKVTGEVSGHADYPDGEIITTSHAKFKREPAYEVLVVVTASGSEYELYGPCSYPDMSRVLDLPEAP